MGVIGGGATDDYSTRNSISEFSKSGHKVTCLRGDGVTAYRFITFRGTFYKELWYWDWFMDHRLTCFTFM